MKRIQAAREEAKRKAVAEAARLKVEKAKQKAEEAERKAIAARERAEFLEQMSDPVFRLTRKRELNKEATRRCRERKSMG